MIEVDKSHILRELMKYKKFTSKADFARFLDITPQGLATWFSRNSFDVNKIASKFPEIDEAWLLTGKGDMLKGGDNTIAAASINYEGKGVPYYDVDFIGGFDLVFNDQTTRPAYYINFPGYDSADCWINVTGHSMEPEVSHGDIVAVKELKDWSTHILYGEMYAIVTEENRTIKYIRRSEEGKDWLRLVPVNKAEYDEQDIPKDVINKVFKVLGSAKRFQ